MLLKILGVICISLLSTLMIKGADKLAEKIVNYINKKKLNKKI